MQHIISRVLETEQVLFASDLVCLGRFHSRPDDPGFAGGEPCSGHTVVFPRRAVWIQHEGRRPFVADPATIPLYNRGQIYSRKPIDPRGDTCEWMAFPLDVIGAPFGRMAAMSSGRIYAAQRRMFAAAAREHRDPVALEEAAVFVLRMVLRRHDAPDRDGPPALDAIEEGVYSRRHRRACAAT